MKLTFLAIIVLLALMMPLLWITGTLTSIIYFYRRWAGKTRKEWAVDLNPQLGLTMADGGDPMKEEKEEPAAATRGTMTGMSQAPRERIALKPVSGKMFWWGGYY